METESALHLRELRLPEMKTIYQTYMTVDFPRNELRPFSSVILLHGQGRYAGYGLFDGQEQLQAYVFFARLQEDAQCHYLVDYLAVLPDRRDRGLGSVLLSLLPEALQTSGCIVGEVEDPDMTEDKAWWKADRIEIVVRDLFRVDEMHTVALERVIDEQDVLRQSAVYCLPNFCKQ